MKKQLRRYLAAVLATVFCMVLAFSGAIPVSAAKVDENERKTVQIAFPQQDGFSEKDTVGDYSGYTYEYLEQIAQYTGWDCEYVTFDNLSTNEGIMKAVEMVSAGELDLLGGMLKTEETEKQFAFSEYSYGIVYTTLSVLENSTQVDESNFRSLTPLRVAVYKTAAIRNAEIEDYLKKENVQYELVYCESYEEQAAALENHQVDVISGTSLNYFAGTKTVAKFAAKPFYFVSSKENKALLDELDLALKSIAYAFPYFQSDLQNKYFAQVSNDFALSERQRALFEEKKSLKVLCMADSAPFVMADSDGQCSGVLVTLMNDFAEQSGLTLEYEWFPYGEDFESFYLENQFDVILGLPVNASYTARLGFITSTAIDSLDILSFRKSANGNKPLSECTVVLMAGSEIANTIPCKKIVFVDTVKECIQAVSNGTADVGYANRSSVSYYSYDIFANLVTTPQVGNKSEISVALSRDLGNEYVAALNSFIRNISDDALAQYYEQATAHNQNVELMARANPIQAMALGSFFISVLFGAVLLLISNIRRKKAVCIAQAGQLGKK